MFSKILIANRGESVRKADASAQPERMQRVALAVELAAGVQHV
jgi:acetyl/propionyl-CoA carboxylase alpha subunit